LSYTHISKSLFWGYLKKDNFLIAEPEKAFCDQVYLAAKGIKKINLDEIDTGRLKKNVLKQYLASFPQTKQFLAMVAKLKTIKTR